MRYYVSGNWGFQIIWGLKGSVFPRAFAMALPNALAAFFYTWFVNEGFFGFDDFVVSKSWINDRPDDSKNIVGVLAAFTTVQFMVLGARSSIAYNRWWEGGTLLQKTRGEWFNAYSSLIAFSSTKLELADRVEQYHHLLARLMSLLFCSGLQQVSPNKDISYEIIDTIGIDPLSLDFLAESPDKVEVILQWIQRSTVLNMEAGILPIPPPILSRAFQEISRGIVNLQNARKIADFPFPFPYAQLSMVMLLVHYCAAPILFSMILKDKFLSATGTFLVVFVLWGINFIALQLEYPYGERDNDLPMSQFQRDWNKSVATLLARRAQQPPVFSFDQVHHRQIGLVMSEEPPNKRDRVFFTSNGVQDPPETLVVPCKDPISKSTPVSVETNHVRQAQAPGLPNPESGAAIAGPNRMKPTGDRIPALSLGDPDGFELGITDADIEDLNCGLRAADDTATKQAVGMQDRPPGVLLVGETNHQLEGAAMSGTPITRCDCVAAPCASDPSEIERNRLAPMRANRSKSDFSKQ